MYTQLESIQIANPVFMYSTYIFIKYTSLLWDEFYAENQTHEFNFV